MQSRWDREFSFIHLSSSGYAAPHSKFGWTNLFVAVFRMDKNDCIVFHSQSSLPYLSLAFLVKKIFFLKGRYIYDIHDFHELNPEVKILSKEYLRYIVFIILEYIVFKSKGIGKITVSDGLAKLIAKRYASKKPFVVRNISLQQGESLKCSGVDVSDSIVYFGTKERVPVDAIPKLVQEGIYMDIYGRGIDENWLRNAIGEYDKTRVRVHGEYFPENLNFLNSYKLTIIFAPQDVSLNFRYSLPNKLFQALAAGLVVLVSDNFEEMIDLFSDVPNAVLPVNINDICDVINNARNHSKFGDNPELSEKIKSIQSESREIYMRATGG